MDTVSTLIGAVVGGGISLCSQLLTERSKAIAERKKYMLNAKVLAGERFFEFSGIALSTFQFRLDALIKASILENDESKKIYMETEKAVENLLIKTTERENTITSASIYFNISDVQTAIEWREKYLYLNAIFVEIDPLDSEYQVKGLDIYNQLKEHIKQMITTIKHDRKIIREEIKKLL